MSISPFGETDVSPPSEETNSETSGDRRRAPLTLLGDVDLHEFKSGSREQFAESPNQQGLA